MKQTLLRYLPKKYHKCVDSFELETDLIDDCKYMLYLNEEYASETSLPCLSIKEAVRFIREYCEVR